MKRSTNGENCEVIYEKQSTQNNINKDLKKHDTNHKSKYKPNNGYEENPVNINNVKTEDNLETEVIETRNKLEDVLCELKLSGRYHMKFLILISLLSLLTAPHCKNYIFAAENVSYRCNYSNCKNSEISTLEFNSTIDYKCHKYSLLHQNGTCTVENFDVSNGTDCTEFVYDKPDSFVAEFDLGCKDWKRTLVGTMHSTGYMIGLLFSGLLSDKFGRKKLFIFNTVAAGVFGVSKSMVTSYWLYIALEMLEPIIGDGYTSIFTLAVETVTKQDRPIIMFLLAVTQSAGDILMAITAYLIPNWRIFLLCTYIPAFLSILYIFLMDESIRWLLTKGKISEAKTIIRRAAKMNGININESVITNLKSEADFSTASLGTSLKITFTSKKLTMRFLICLCVWFTSLFNTYSLFINSVSLEGNKYVNYGLLSLSGVLTSLLILYVLKKFKRKGPLIFSLTLTGVFCVAQSFLPKEYSWLSILFYICGLVNSGNSLLISYLYTTELFPTYTRNTMLALCSSLGRTAAILAPQTPLLLKYWIGLPSLLIGVLSLITASVVTLMPDTSVDVLPDNVNQAEAIGSSNKVNN